MSSGHQKLLEKARELTHQYASKQLFPTAVYWADKAHSLSGGDPNDLAAYVQALSHNQEYQRACHVLHNSPFLAQSSSLRYLAARSDEVLGFHKGVWPTCHYCCSGGGHRG